MNTFLALLPTSQKTNVENAKKGTPTELVESVVSVMGEISKYVAALSPISYPPSSLRVPGWLTSDSEPRETPTMCHASLLVLVLVLVLFRTTLTATRTRRTASTLSPRRKEADGNSKSSGWH